VKLVVVLGSLRVRDRTASCGPVFVDWSSYGHWRGRPRTNCRRPVHRQVGWKESSL